MEEFVATANKLAAHEGLSDKGDFVVGNMLALSEVLDERRFSHVTAISCLIYVHDKIEGFLRNLVPHCEEGAALLIQDFSRTVPLEEVYSLVYSSIH